MTSGDRAATWPPLGELRRLSIDTGIGLISGVRRLARGDARHLRRYPSLKQLSRGNAVHVVVGVLEDQAFPGPEGRRRPRCWRKVAAGPRRRSLSAAPPLPASPCRGPRRRVHRARSAPRPADLRAGVPGRHVPCAGRPGHLTLNVAPLASPTADSSPSPLIDTGPFTSPKQLPTTRAVITTYPQPISKSDVPHTPCTAGSNPGRPDRAVACTPFR